MFGLPIPDKLWHPIWIDRQAVLKVVRYTDDLVSEGLLAIPSQVTLALHHQIPSRIFWRSGEHPGCARCANHGLGSAGPIDRTSSLVLIPMVDEQPADI